MKKERYIDTHTSRFEVEYGKIKGLYDADGGNGAIAVFKNGDPFSGGGINIQIREGNVIRNHTRLAIYIDKDNKVTDVKNKYTKYELNDYLNMLRQYNSNIELDEQFTVGIEGEQLGL